MIRVSRLTLNLPRSMRQVEPPRLPFHDTGRDRGFVENLWQAYCAARDAFEASPSVFTANRAVKAFDKWVHIFCPTDADKLTNILRAGYEAKIGAR